MSDQVSTQQAGVAVTSARKGPTGPPPAAPRQAGPSKFQAAVKKWAGPALVAAVVLAAGAYFAWQWWRQPKLPAGFASSNGRIEATEIDIATKLAGRIADELADEGNFVKAGDVLAHMDIEMLKAQRREALAKRDLSKATVEAATSTLEERTKQKEAALAQVALNQADLAAKARKFHRDEQLIGAGSVAQEIYDADQAAYLSANASLATAKANVAAADAAIATARAMIIAAQANVADAEATIARVQADINDSALKAPRSGRVQYRVAQPGEVLPGGGKVMNMIDLNDVYMTFFLPTDWAGKVKVGAECRIVLDAAPEFVIPARVTFVADVAQFTPKTVETAVERQKLTFRIKAHIPAELLKKYVKDVKTGLPGVAYVQLDPDAAWPAHLEVKLPQ